jgi:hypothetical protein
LSIRTQLTLSTVSTGCPHGDQTGRPLGRFGHGVEIATWALGSKVAVLSGIAIRVRRRKHLRRQQALGYTTCCCCSATCCPGTSDNELQDNELQDNELQAGVAFIGDDVTSIDSLEPPWPAWSMRSDDHLTDMQIAGDRVAKRVNASSRNSAGPTCWSTTPA